MSDSAKLFSSSAELLASYSSSAELWASSSAEFPASSSAELSTFSSAVKSSIFAVKLTEITWQPNEAAKECAEAVKQPTDDASNVNELTTKITSTNSSSWDFPGVGSSS